MGGWAAVSAVHHCQDAQMSRFVTDIPSGGSELDGGRQVSPLARAAAVCGRPHAVAHGLHLGGLRRRGSPSPARPGFRGSCEGSCQPSPLEVHLLRCLSPPCARPGRAEPGPSCCVSRVRGCCGGSFGEHAGTEVSELAVY